MYELTNDQKEVIKVLKWLLSPGKVHSKSGRSTVLAHTFIQLAIENNGAPLFIQDHAPYPYSKANLMKKIIEIWNENYAALFPDLYLRVKSLECQIKIKRKELRANEFLD